ncbi:MAG: TldD/PmbA family protein [Nanoarchaeota archaeon]|nr:TldD/PmbA family protein [Nanoarchaeota archaeon]
MEDIAEFCVRYLEKKGCGYVEVRVEEKDINGLLLKNGTPELGGFDAVKGMGIRFLFDDALGFISLNDFEKERVKANLNRALRVTKSASKINENTFLSEEKAIKKTYKVKQRINFDNISGKEKLSLLKDIYKGIEDKNLIGSFLSLDNEVARKFYVNNQGAKITSEIPRANYVYYVTVGAGDKTMQRFWQYGDTKGWEAVKSWNLNKLMVEEVDALNNNLINGVEAPKGKMDLVVGPEVTGIMVHESCGHPCEADRIFGRESAQAGESFITNKMLGTNIGNKVVSIVDDPTLEGTYGHFLYDDEGVKTRRNYLYKEGVINGFLHNRETAVATGIKSNGCARASDYDKETIVRMSNTFLLKGNMKENELIKGVKKGVYMKNFMEWNIDDRRWQQKYVGCEAYLIENGKITKPVRNSTIEITTPKLWSSVDAVGNNFELHAGTCGKGEPMQGIPVTFGGPSMRLRNIRLS